jgi:hypothetical protein
MKSSSDGPCSSVSLKLSFFGAADDPDVAAGVASERICLETHKRATCEFLRMNVIVHYRRPYSTEGLRGREATYE